MGVKITGIKATKRLLDQLEDMPKKIAEDVLKQTAEDAMKIIKKYAPKDTGNSLTALEILSYKTDGERYFSYSVGFNGAKWEVWRGLWVANFGFENMKAKGTSNVGWMNKAQKEISKLLESRLEKAINQYLRSLGG